VRPSLTSKQWRALAAVVSRTLAWGRLEDSVTHTVLNATAGLDRADLRKALHELVELGLIEYRPGAGRRFSVVGVRRAVAPPLDEPDAEAGVDARGCNLPVVDEPSPPSKEGDTAPGEEGGSALDERNGLPERTTERTEGVADATPSPAAAATREHAEEEHGRGEPSSWFERAQPRIGAPTATPAGSEDELTLDDAVRDRVLFGHYVAPYAQLVDEPGPSS
jgi:hypothetical protein